MQYLQSFCVDVVTDFSPILFSLVHRYTSTIFPLMLSTINFWWAETNLLSLYHLITGLGFPFDTQANWIDVLDRFFLKTRGCSKSKTKIKIYVWYKREEYLNGDFFQVFFLISLLFVSRTSKLFLTEDQRHIIRTLSNV